MALDRSYAGELATANFVELHFFRNYLENPHWLHTGLDESPNRGEKRPYLTAFRHPKHAI